LKEIKGIKDNIIEGLMEVWNSYKVAFFKKDKKEKDEKKDFLES